MRSSGLWNIFQFVIWKIAQLPCGISNSESRKLYWRWVLLLTIMGESQRNSCSRTHTHTHLSCRPRPLYWPPVPFGPLMARLRNYQETSVTCPFKTSRLSLTSSSWIITVRVHGQLTYQQSPSVYCVLAYTKVIDSHVTRHPRTHVFHSFHSARRGHLHYFHHRCHHRCRLCGVRHYPTEVWRSMHGNGAKHVCGKAHEESIRTRWSK